MASEHILPEICEGEGAEKLDLGPIAAEERGDGSEEARAGLQGRDADHGLDAVCHSFLLIRSPNVAERVAERVRLVSGVVLLQRVLVYSVCVVMV